MYPLTRSHAPQTAPLWPQRRERILAVGAAVQRWSQQMAWLHRHLHITTVTWPTPLVTSNSPALAVLPPPTTTFDLVHVQFLNLLLPQSHWPAVVAELVARVAPGGAIAFTDAPLIATFPPASALAAVEALTRLVTDALHGAPFVPERVAALLAQTPGVVASTIMTTSDLVPLGSGPDPRGSAIADLWLAQRRALFPLLARFGVLPGGERRCAALARDAQSDLRTLQPPVWWRITTTRAQIAPAWRTDLTMGRVW